MSEKPQRKPNWPSKAELMEYEKDPDTVARTIEFSFLFNNKYGPMPFAITADPELTELDDMILLLLISTTIRSLSKRHGLEETLEKVNEIAYGRINGKRVLKIGDYKKQD